MKRWKRKHGVSADKVNEDQQSGTIARYRSIEKSVGERRQGEMNKIYRGENTIVAVKPDHDFNRTTLLINRKRRMNISSPYYCHASQTHTRALKITVIGGEDDLLGIVEVPTMGYANHFGILSLLFTFLS